MECFENSPENVSVSGGLLNLTVEQTPAPFVCPSLPPYPTQYTSGMVTTYKRFNQAYGLFEVRAKISGTTQQGLQTSFWLYPAKLTYGPWPDSGEVDIAELFQFGGPPRPSLPSTTTLGQRPQRDAQQLRHRRPRPVPPLRPRVDAAVDDPSAKSGGPAWSTG